MVIGYRSSQSVITGTSAHRCKKTLNNRYWINNNMYALSSEKTLKNPTTNTLSEFTQNSYTHVSRETLTRDEQKPENWTQELVTNSQKTEK